MTGPEHYREAERLQPIAQELMDSQMDTLAMPVLAQAQVHATLALAAATALRGEQKPYTDWQAWYATAAVKPQSVTT